jgi:hypothetical protein
MGKLYEIVFDFFHDQAEHDSLPMIKLDYEGAAGRWTLYVRVREEAEQVIGLSELPARTRSTGTRRWPSSSPAPTTGSISATSK